MKVSSLTLLAALLLPMTAQSAELKVLAGGSLTASLKELAPKFEQATGHKLDIVFAATPDLVRMATSAPFDAGVVPIDVMRNAQARATLAAAEPITIARIGFGVAVRAGAPKPDISTAVAFRTALLQARSIALLPESAAGAYVLKVFDRLGIADAMKQKTLAQTSPAAIAQAVANGEAELGVFLTNVLIAPGVEPVGPFPGDLQQDLVLVGAIAKDARAAQAAQALLAFLTTSEAVAVFRQKGVTPP